MKVVGKAFEGLLEHPGYREDAVDVWGAAMKTSRRPTTAEVRRHAGAVHGLGPAGYDAGVAVGNPAQFWSGPATVTG